MRKISRVYIILTGLILLALFVLPGCGGAKEPAVEPTQEAPPTEPLPTNTPEPTDTPEPSATPEPTATFTPVPTDTAIPTETPDLQATASAEAAATAVALEATMKEELAKLEIVMDTGKLAWVQTEPLKITLDAGEGWDIAGFAEGQTFSDFIMKAEITWNSKAGFAGCGLVFRSEPNYSTGDNYRLYTIRFSGLPLWDIELWKNGEWVMTLGGRPRSNGAINQEDGATNIYIIKAEKDLFTAFANGERLSRLQNSTLQEGAMGLLIFQESGTTTCEMKNAWIWSLK